MEEESSLSAEEIEVMRQTSYHEGFEAGRVEAIVRLEQRQTDLLQRLTEQLTFIEESSQDALGQFTADAVRVSQRLVQALSPQLVALGKDKEIASLLQQCFSHLRNEPHLLVRCAAGDLPMAQTLAESLSRRAGWRGELQVEADAGLSAGDCVVLWENGRAERLQAAIAQQIEQLVLMVGG